MKSFEIFLAAFLSPFRGLVTHGNNIDFHIRELENVWLKG